MLQGQHAGEFIRRDYVLRVTHNYCDREELHISAIFREKDGMIEGDLQLTLED